MSWIVAKYLLTAAVVVLVSEAAKRSDKLGGFLAALPLITLLTLIWLHVERQPMDKIANHAWYTFWYVLPTLPMFLVFPSAATPRLLADPARRCAAHHHLFRPARDSAAPLRHRPALGVGDYCAMLG